MTNMSVLRQFVSTFALLVLALPALAQDPSSEAGTEAQPASAQADEVDVLLTKIKETNGELVRLVDEAPAAAGDDLLIMRSQIDELAKELGRDLVALIDLISIRKKTGADVTLLEQQAEQLLSRTSRRLRSHIQTFQGALAEEAAKRSTLATGELEVFEYRMADETSRLDYLYGELIQLADEMARFGLNVDDEDAFLGRQLTERGQALLQLLELTGKQLAEFKQLLKKVPVDSELQEKVFAAEERYDSNKTSLLATIHMMKTLGLDYTDLEVRFLEFTGEVTPEALEAEVALGLLKRSLVRGKTHLAENGPRFLLRLLVIVGILALFWVLARLARRITSKVADRTKLSTSTLLKEMVISMAGRVVLFIGLVIVLSQLGINLGPLLAGLGIAGFIVGFALQDTLSNFAAGAMILAYRPFDVGDLVEAAGVMGKVRDMNLVSTRILTVDHQTLIVPNRKIWGDVIRNVTAQPRRRIDMVFGISYEDEIPRAEQVLQEIVASHDKVLDDPEPMVKVHTLNDSSVDFVVRPWAKTDDYWDVYWDITREVKMRFDKEGIAIPYPQRDVHLIGK